MTQRRMLTGDTPTGQLHLGHWVGSVRRRVELQKPSRMLCVDCQHACVHHPQ